MSNMDNSINNTDNSINSTENSIGNIDPAPDHTSTIPDLQRPNLVAVRLRRPSYTVPPHQRGETWVNQYHVNEHEQTYYVKKKDEPDGKEDDTKKQGDIHGVSPPRKCKPVKKQRTDRSIFMGGRRPEDCARARGFVFPAQGVAFLTGPDKSGSSDKEDGKGV